MTRHFAASVKHAWHIRPATGAAAVVALTALALTACAPGAAPQSTETRKISTAAPTEQKTLKVAVPPNATLTALFEEFERQYPTVTINAQETDFATLQQNLPRLMANDGAPDLVRLASVGNNAQNGLLTNLDPYRDAYGWDAYPTEIMNMMSVADDGVTRGTGSLYLMMGAGWNIVGVYYNRSVAAELGIDAPPATLEEFEGMLATAQAAGVVPIGQPSVALNYVYDTLTYNYAADAGTLDQIKDWQYRVEGADFDQPATRAAGETLQQWQSSGFFPADYLSMTEEDAAVMLKEGRSLFYITGDWNSGAFDESMGDNAGFFFLPPVGAGGPFGTDASAQTWGVPSKGAEPDLAAFFLNWVNSDATAREITVTLAGNAPGGQSDWEIAPAGPVTSQTLAAGVEATKADALVDFFADTTAGIQATTFAPQLELLASGKITVDEFVAKVQADYESELGR